MTFRPFPVLRSARLRLREIVPRDTDAWFALHADPELMRWYGSDVLTARSQMEKQIADFAAWCTAGAGIRWGIEYEHRFIGSCGFARWNKAWHNAMLGYELAREYQGQGLMQEALTTILDYGFTEMQLHRVHAEIHHDNTASLRLVERLGFRFEGVHREIGFWGGRWHDLDYYGLLEQEWCETRIASAQEV